MMNEETQCKHLDGDGGEGGGGGKRGGGGGVLREYDE